MGFGLTKGASAQFPENGRPSVWRLALSWTLLIAFALQSYATQTHVHRASITPIASGAISTASAIGSPQPGDQEAIACPFCQAIAAAGAFVGPAPVAFFLPALRAEAASLPPIAIFLAIAPAGFSWRSRAPPQS
ncbi:MAG TPA: DUF2946 family protein [Caulobacteraceae bacterium]|jgi:hypothetical protein